MSASPLHSIRALRASRPTSASVPVQSGFRPSSAPNPASRPMSGKKKGQLPPNIMEYCTRLRTLASAPKSSSGDREALLAVVDAFELMKAQKEDAASRARDTDSKLSALKMENAEVRDRLAELEELVAEYKKLDIVAEMMSSDQLAESIGDIHATIHRYNPVAKKSAVAAVPADEDAKDVSMNDSTNKGGPARPMSPSQLVMQANIAAGIADSFGDDPDALNEGLQTHTLLQDKLRALERLVFILKKRILAFESNHELLEMMQKYGSVQGMLDKMAQIQAENDKLRLREVAFQRDPLLRRRVCAPTDATVTPVVLLALQNELTSAYAVMDHYNMARHRPLDSDDPARCGSVDGVEAEGAECGPVTIEDMLSEGSLDDKALNALAPCTQEEPAELHPPTEHELMHRLNTMEFENSALKNKQRRLETQVELFEGRKMALEDIAQLEDAYLRGGAMLLGGEEARLVVKEKKLARLQKYNDILVAKVGAWEQAIADKDATIVCQNELISHLTEQKRQMASDVACLSQLCSTYKQDLRARQATLNKQTHRLRALYEMAQAMALASLHPEDLPADYQHNNMPFVGFIYKDILRAHVILIRASSRVQKVFRGHAGRRLYRRKAAARGLPPLPLPWRLAVKGSAKTPKIPAVARGGEGGRTSLVLGYLEPLCRVLITLPEGVRVAAQSSELCRKSSMQTKMLLRPQVVAELAAFADYLATASRQIARAVQVLTPAKCDASAEAGTTLECVPHLRPCQHVEKTGGPWVGMWQQPPIFVKKHLSTQVQGQTPSDEAWAQVDQPAWTRPGFAKPDE